MRHVFVSSPASPAKVLLLAAAAAAALASCAQSQKEGGLSSGGGESSEASSGSGGSSASAPGSGGAGTGGGASSGSGSGSGTGSGGAGSTSGAGGESSSTGAGGESSTGASGAGGAGAAGSGAGPSSSGAGGAGSCAHDVCDTGVSLVPGCDPCVDAVCAHDPYCCEAEWDGTCVDEVADFCGQSCGGGSGAGGGGVGGGGSSGSSGSGGGGPCAHDKCVAGEALWPACDPCVAKVCDADGYCCSTEWDDTCIDEVGDYCGVSCGGGGAGGGGAGGGGSGGLGPGDLVITEIMNNPKAVNDDKGEWFEVHNPGKMPVDLAGLQIRHQLANPNVLHTIDQTVVVPPGGYVVLGLNGDPAANGGVKVDYVYPGAIALGNDDDVLSIQTADSPPVVIDSVTWGKGPYDGASRSLSPKLLDAQANDDPASFCPATSFIKGNAGDKGTPGKANDPCP